MAVEIISSVAVDCEGDPNGTTGLTVPADATIIIIGACGYRNFPSSWVDPVFSISSDGFTQLQNTNTDDRNMMVLEYILTSVTGTGAMDLNWDFEPQIRIEEGVRETVKYMKENWK